MSTTFTWFAIAVAVGLSATPVSAQQPLEASLSFISEAGDYIGGGQSASYTLDTASFSSRSSDNGRHFNVFITGFNGDWWHLDLAAPAGMQLVPGPYDGATRYPFQNPDVPGLSFFGNGRGCNTLTGRFDVHEAIFGPNGYIEQLHATFEQHCEGFEPALFGEVRIVNPPPPPVLEVGVTIDSRARVNRVSGRAYVTATFGCTTPTVLSMTLRLEQRLTRFSQATATSFVSLPCMATPDTVTLELVPTGNVPFSNGMAVLDVAALAYDNNYNDFVRVNFAQQIRLAPR